MFKTEVLAFMTVLISALGGCGHGDMQPVPDLLPTWPPPGMDLSRYSTPDLLRLLSRSDPAFEEKVTGGRDVRIIDAALRELSSRLSTGGPDAVTPDQRKDLAAVLHRHLPHMIEDEPLWLFAAKYDGDYVVTLYERDPALMAFNYDLAVRCLLLATTSDRAWGLLRAQLGRMPELQLCQVIGLLGEYRVSPAADFIFSKTRDSRWLVRLSAVYALNCLDDDRVNAAMKRALVDIQRHAEVFGGDRASRKMLGDFLRQQLAEAVAARRIPGSAGALVGIVGNKREGMSSPRISAGRALLSLDPERGREAVGRRLMDANNVEQKIGIMMAEGHVEVFLDLLLRLEREGSDPEVKGLAAQVLSQKHGTDTRPDGAGFQQ